ncbi:MAG: TetR/AcrR family transcriptional regulator [Bacteroidota bacterium]|nr:TetR/AcrR family transcriptional regulator [Bacteroidota bacterium]
MYKENEILLKARDMFLKYGIRSITMDDLARELGISKKTLYQNFKDKADLISKMVIAEINRVMNDMQNIFEEKDNTIDRMIKINNHLIKIRKNTPENISYDLHKYYPEIEKNLNKITEEKMFLNIKENHKQGQAEGLIRKNLNLDIIAALQVTRSSVVYNIKNIAKAENIEIIINEIFDYHIRAISTDKGLDYYFKNYKNK